ncbi:hypothetical protein JYU14_05185 [Simkania negevensis]|uniref:Uncharacterized protein n=1 Tax=Simkania negevensis TaxID=83561 RepID=A0ABS3ASE1_9BACT|nr:hypothetical protein [Simkania negevensis]
MTSICPTDFLSQQTYFFQALEESADSFNLCRPDQSRLYICHGNPLHTQNSFTTTSNQSQALSMLDLFKEALYYIPDLPEANTTRPLQNFGTISRMRFRKEIGSIFTFFCFGDSKKKQQLETLEKAINAWIEAHFLSNSASTGETTPPDLLPHLLQTSSKGIQ